MGLLRIAMALASIFNFFLPMAASIDPNCDYYQELVVGQTYYINNVEYPQYYNSYKSCRWFAQSPLNTLIVLSCEDIDLPASDGCKNDRLSVSLTGNANFQDAQNYCGKGSKTFISKSNTLAVGLFAPYRTQGGKFVCSVTAIQDGAPTTTTPRPQVCDCGWRQGTRIVGGNETGVNEYPMMAALIDSTIRDLYCGAVIISNHYVLTAAHCVINREVSTLGVLVGDHDISTGAETPYSKLYRAIDAQINPGYNPRTQINDLALIKTESEITFSLYVGPVCLPFRYSSESFVGRKLIALGWGQTEFAGPKSDTLQQVQLNVVTNSECQAALKDNVITMDQICTYAPGQDSCQSDSGGPLLYWDPDTRRLQLAGIISYGLACASSNPGVNTRVSSYLTWILQTTSESTYCVK